MYAFSVRRTAARIGREGNQGIGGIRAAAAHVIIGCPAGSNIRAIWIAAGLAMGTTNNSVLKGDTLIGLLPIAAVLVLSSLPLSLLLRFPVRRLSLGSNQGSSQGNSQKRQHLPTFQATERARECVEAT
jgi:hypothetical protein